MLNAKNSKELANYYLDHQKKRIEHDIIPVYLIATECPSF